MSKIIFINPPMSHFQRYGYLGEVLGELQPVNLCYLAAVTVSAGFDTKIIDAPAEKLNLEDLMNRIVRESPQYVGITATTCSISNAGLLAKEIKQYNPKIVTIVGGVHISALPKETMQRFYDIDIGVVGEGEKTIVELLLALENNFDLNKVDGILFRQDGRLVFSNPRPLIDELDMLPMPSWQLLPSFWHYMPNLSSFYKLPVASLVTSRGCPKSCIFCDKCVFGNRIRSHSAKYTIEMIKYLYLYYGVRYFVFKDHDFAFSANRTRQICEALRKNDLKINWSCMARPDDVDGSILAEMKNAGCWQIGFGIESGSQRILDFLSKGIQVDKVTSVIQLCNRFRINVMGYFIIGSPTESEDTIRETVKFIKKVKMDNIKVNFFTPYPGSPIYKDIRNFGDFTEDWLKMNEGYPVFIPFGLSQQQLIYFSKKLLREFYFQPRIIMNYLFRSLRPSVFLKFFKGMLALMKYILKFNTKEMKIKLLNC